MVPIDIHLRNTTAHHHQAGFDNNYDPQNIPDYANSKPHTFCHFPYESISRSTSRYLPDSWEK